MSDRFRRDSRPIGIGLAALAIIPGLATGAPAKEWPHRLAAPPAAAGCEWAGPNFQKVEGSDTCVRVSGSVSVETTIRTGGGGSFFPSAPRR